MTVYDAIEAAEAMRPDNRISTDQKYIWLAEMDAMLRAEIYSRAAFNGGRSAGADEARQEGTIGDDTELLAGAPYDALYVHYLCAQMDAAVGESERANSEMQQVSSLRASLAAWVRQNYMPRKNTKLRW